MRPVLPTAVLLALPLVSAAATQGSPPAGVHVETDDQGRSALALRAPFDMDGARAGQALKLSVESSWAPLGPFGGDVADVAVRPGTPNVVLAGLAPSSGSGGGLFRSIDAGASWTEVPSLVGKSVYDLEFAADGTGWAGTIDGPWKSVDSGATWTAVPLGIGPNDQVLEITLDPLLPARLWVGVADALGSQTQLVLRSDNGGTSWSNVTPPLTTLLGCKGIAVDPVSSGHVFACFAGSFGGGAIWRTLNGGTSWTNVSAGIPANPLNDVQFDGARVLVCGGQLFGSQAVGLFSSLTDGASWTPLHDGTWPTLVIQDIELDPADGNRIYLASAGAGVFRSVNDGATWDFSYGGTEGLSVNAVAVAPPGTAPIYAGSSSVAVWKSPSGGAFAPSSAGIGSLNTVSVSANPLNTDELAVAFEGLNDGGVYTSTNGGISWSLAALPGTRFNTADFAPDGTLYAISDGPSSIAPEGVYRRDPGGWVSIGPDQGTLFESELFTLAFSPSDPDLVFAGGADFGVAGFEATVWRTPDGGGQWTKTYESVEANEQVHALLMLETGTELDLVAAFQDFGQQTGGALRSSNGGFTWVPSSTGLPPLAQATSLAADTLSPVTVYLANNSFTGGGVYRSLDKGASWSLHGAAGRTLRVDSDPKKPDRFFVAQQDLLKVSVSNDGGLSYSPYDTGLAAAGFVNDLSLAPGQCERLLLATTTGSFGRIATCELEGQGTTISVAGGGSQALALARGPAAAGDSYWIFGSVSGTSPGTTAFGITLPLNFDFYLFFTLTHGSNGLIAGGTGVLDAGGEAQALFGVPAGLIDPSLIGTTVNHAFATFILSPFTVLSGSNAVGVLLAP